MGKKYQYTDGEIDSAVAIAMHLGMHRGRQQAYEAAGESMGGFPGFYQAAIAMGISLEEYADKHGITWGEDANWIMTTEVLANQLMRFMVNERRLPDPKERLELVKASIIA